MPWGWCGRACGSDTWRAAACSPAGWRAGGCLPAGVAGRYGLPPDDWRLGWATAACGLLRGGEAVLEEKEHQKKERFVATETNGHGDALCFMVKTWAQHKTTETVLNNGWRLVAVGGWRLVVLKGCA